jgi:hypothetical protein
MATDLRKYAHFLKYFFGLGANMEQQNEGCMKPVFSFLFEGDK